MELTIPYPKNKLRSFLIGTVIFQGIILLSAVYLHTLTENQLSPEEIALNRYAESDAQHIEDPKAGIDVEEPVSKEEISPPQHSDQIQYEVKPADTLTKIWVANGGTYAGGLSAANAFKAAGVQLNSLRVGESLTFVRSAEGDIVRFEKKLSPEKILILEGTSSAGYTYKIDTKTVVEKKKVVSGIIDSSFAVSALKEEIPYTVIDDFVDLFSSRVEFRRDLQPGDSFTIIYNDRVTESGELMGTSSIVAASLKLEEQMMVAVGYRGKDGELRYFDQNGNLLGNYFLRYPLSFSRISSAFSTARFHPLLERFKPHNGVDFAAPLGTAVRSVADGVVESAGWNGGAGKMVRIRHSSRYSTAYLHLSKISDRVKPGARIGRGQVIGAVGQTGTATGPHLHFSLYDKGRYVDPLKAPLPSMPVDKGISIPPTVLQINMEALRNGHEQVVLAHAAVTSPEA